MEQIAAMARGDLETFAPGWSAALRVAEVMTTQGGRVDDARFHALAEHWSPTQIVEIIAVIGLFNYFNRFANALDIPPTR